MRLAILSDLHYGSHNEAYINHLARKIKEDVADNLIICGDATNGSFARLSELLSLFNSFKGNKLFVIGNHDLYDQSGLDTREKYFDLQDYVERFGFHSLDKHSKVIDGIGFVGNVGWYDYSFRVKEGEIPGRIITSSGNYSHWEDIPREDYQVKSCVIFPDGSHPFEMSWNDRNYTSIKSDENFLEQRLRELERSLDQVSQQTKEIVVITHHIPFENLVTRDPNNLGYSVGNAYMGSEKIGQLLKRYPQVKYSICGHSHSYKETKNQGIKSINVSGEIPRVTYLDV